MHLDRANRLALRTRHTIACKLGGTLSSTGLYRLMFYVWNARSRASSQRCRPHNSRHRLPPLFRPRVHNILFDDKIVLR